MCAIIGIYNNSESSTLAYMGLYAQQHRGQEGAGIVAANGISLSRHMGEGLVSEVFSDGEIFKGLKGNMAIGHTRYSTTGNSDAKNVGPLMFNLEDTEISIAHNGNLVNIDHVRKKLHRAGSLFQTATDTELIIHLLAREVGGTISERLSKALNSVQGAYSLLVITPNEMIVARDPRGIRPLCMGKLNDSYIFASETCALDLLGATYIREVNPGEMIVLNGGSIKSFQFTESLTPKHCIFEYIYFSRPDSKIFSENVDKIRRKFGKNLADESPAPTADIVLSVPDSSNTCALGYSSRSNIKYEIGLIRNHYVGRTFIFPDQRLRDLSVRLKFNTVKGVLEGREVVVVDDSIVRGTTLRKLAKLLKESGVEKIHVRISSPPVKNPCFYGMNFPTHGELVANNNEVDEIRNIIEVDSLSYMSLDALLNSVDQPDHYCTACFSGDYPLPIQGEE
ncbi:MAG: amidophosphoribosyltransferase [Candidatus Marinimicrobia bacterium]|jgi:amidophosphoribosyltransferase|nr:amidophosphoribosyltransferase [Candidatus Neomarinimicrobiota bacterium]MBT3634655.1 amidophosphoribosyltransferase [Candidatus Neomarinimicrobiota bacterium]MBT3682715.1 amidophosphoribosyltransferase [Candidatus Neomarinimicrobiota bacterium]MBT3759630.1 amidophosphoribosyltransferase [Candidatus Neomarinimicrobiota bacterium]MBT3894498.1 amidophosphoribosyltransferase [Candidatus Neomarinimicrobiota bacterium]